MQRYRRPMMALITGVILIMGLWTAAPAIGAGKHIGAGRHVGPPVSVPVGRHGPHPPVSPPHVGRP
jgi:hypothetical protein